MSKPQTFETGAIVRLKSGSPDMTVCESLTNFSYGDKKEPIKITLRDMVAEHEASALPLSSNSTTTPPKPITDYRCQWFAGQNLKSDVFPSQSLALVKSEPKGK